MKRVRYSKEALTNLVELAEYISRDDPGAALRWVSKLHKRFHQAAVAPLTGREVPQLRRPDVREVLLRTYRLVYQVKKGEVLLLTVFEGHRLHGQSKLRKRLKR